MRKLLFLILIIQWMIVYHAISQVPSLFPYQAVVRTQSGEIIGNQNVNIRISIIPGSAEGIADFIEIHTTTTNQFGLINLEIGDGTNIKGNIDSLNWDEDTWFMKIEMDEAGGTDFKLLGTTQFLSVPYALYAKYAENVDDADADPQNELITDLRLNGAILTIVETGENTVDLAPISETDNQNLILTGDILTIEDGQGSVDLSQYINDADADSTNELITDVFLDGTTLHIIDANEKTIDLSSLTGTDDQDLVIDGDILSIEDGQGTVDLSKYVNDADADSLNELITDLRLNGTILTIVESGEEDTVDLAPIIGTDDQDLVMTGDVLSIEGGEGSVDLSQYINDADADPTNELQALSITGDSLKISGGNAVYLSGIVDFDPDPANEIQDLKLTGNILTLTLKTSPTQINLNPYLDNTDEQILSVSHDTIFLTNGGFIKLPAENDPVFNASIASGITGTDTSRWNAKSDFDGDYNSLANKPDLSIYLTNDIDSLGDFITDAGNKTITNLANPVNAQDATTKAYVDSLFEVVRIVQQGLTDIDGNHYKVVRIGNQYWMAENLKTTKYADGTSLIDGTDSTDISGDDSTKYWFVYDDTSMHKETYGLLYTWAAVMNDSLSSDANPSGVQGVCPMGWHIPSDAEWKELEMFLGMSQAEADVTTWRGTDEGGKLKETGTTHWNSPNTGATNSSGFTALPGGYRYPNGNLGTMGNSTYLWSSTEKNSIYTWNRGLDYNYSEVYRNDFNKSYSMSVRCIRD